MERIYLDYAATTPIDPEVSKAMNKVGFGNPSSLHFFGREALASLDKSRETLAGAIGANQREIIFTGSATEANNLALRGVARGISFAFRGAGGLFSPIDKKFLPKIIISAVEHESVFAAAKDLEKNGEAEVVCLRAHKDGIVDPEELKKKLDERTALVSVMHANNETGAIQPIFEISKILRDFKINLNKEIKNSKKRLLKDSDVLDFGNLNLFRNPDLEIRNYAKVFPLLHCDAVQTFQFLDCDVNKLGVDMLTLSAHKIYGPKGVGLLYSRNSKHETLNSKKYQNQKELNSKRVSDFENSNLEFVSPARINEFIRSGGDFGFRTSDLPHSILSIVTGGNQEFGLRAGTENISGISGFAKAANLALKKRESERKRLFALRVSFWKKIKNICPEAEINGPGEEEFKKSVPHILNVWFPGHSSEKILIFLDMRGIAVSAGSACKMRSLEPSRVIMEMHGNKARARESVRFSFGRDTNARKINGVISALKSALAR